MVDPSCLSRSPKKFSTLVIIRVNGFVLNKAEHDRRQSEHSSSFSLERVGMFCDPPPLVSLGRKSRRLSMVSGARTGGYQTSR